MKKIVVILFIMACLFAVTSCKKNQNSSTEDDNSIEITLMNYNEYLEFDSFVSSSSTKSSINWQYADQLEPRLSVELKDGYELVEAIVIEYKGHVWYPTGTGYKSSSYDFSSTVVLTDKRATDRTSKIVNPYFFKGNGKSPSLDETVIAISGKIKAI